MTLLYPILDHVSRSHFHDHPMWALLEDQPWTCGGPLRRRPRQRPSSTGSWERIIVPTRKPARSVIQAVVLAKKDAETPESKTSKSEAPASMFETKVNVSDFLPEELSVKTVGNSIVVEGKHEEKDDGHGFVSRSLMRRIAVPENVKPETVECKFSSDGFLVISAPLAIAEPVVKERSIPIILSHQPAAPAETATPTQDQTARSITPDPARSEENLVEVEDLGDEDSRSSG